MGAEIKECPFCHSHFVRTTQHLFSFNVECSNCHATGPRKKNLVTAILSWNHLAQKIEKKRFCLQDDLINRITNIEKMVHKLEVELKN
ncbi:Lar family restriction alleviation protein [Gynuella sunshinyii]|uniref:Lar family restriction alleviation protein n=1 Tax=Gynuella sunshinyii TaxID=1445505 RepID=UPI0005CBA1C5|nr:Lar family restriction alleviation protein [Gynuella sunshinyii]